MARYLIVNADDFGQTGGINEGVVEAHERGLVTSASLMVGWDAAGAAADYAAAHPELSVGLHVDLGEWVYRDGQWHVAHHVVETSSELAVARELDRQLEAFERLVGRAPTHLDSHQHVHRSAPTRALVAAAGRRLGVPVRDLTSTISYRGDFYGQTGKGEPYLRAITAEALEAVLRTLPEGWTELGCHPGRRTQGLVYGVERERELAVLCDDLAREVVVELGIELRSFHDAATLASD